MAETDHRRRIGDDLDDALEAIGRVAGPMLEKFQRDFSVAAANMSRAFEEATLRKRNDIARLDGDELEA